MAARVRQPRGVPVENVQRHAEALFDLLVDTGPLTAEDCCRKLGWTRGQFGTAVRFARERICPVVGATIPAATPSGGWTYQVTTEWQPVGDGASWTLGLVESRLKAIHRDVRIVLPHLERGTRDWRRANFLDKHLGHILSTLAEIG